MRTGKPVAVARFAPLPPSAQAEFASFMPEALRGSFRRVSHGLFLFLNTSGQRRDRRMGGCKVGRRPADSLACKKLFRKRHSALNRLIHIVVTKDRQIKPLRQQSSGLLNFHGASTLSSDTASTRLFFAYENSCG
jgi:hypothetical protein